MEQLVPELFTALLKQGAFAGLLFFILYVANKERTLYRTKVDQLNEDIRERLLKAMNDNTNSLKELKDLLSRASDRGSK